MKRSDGRSRSWKRKRIGLCMLLVNLLQKNLVRIIMMFLFLMLRHNLVVSIHPMIMIMITTIFTFILNQIIIKKLIMIWKWNLVKILITHILKINVMIRKTLSLESMVNKEIHGFKDPCHSLVSLLRVRMRRILNALLKCLDLSFAHMFD